MMCYDSVSPRGIWGKKQHGHVVFERARDFRSGFRVKTMYQWRTHLKSYPLPPKTQMKGRIRDQLFLKAKNR